MSDFFEPALTGRPLMMLRFPVRGLRALILSVAFGTVCLPALLPMTAAAASLNPSRPAVIAISRAYGFVAGQGIALDMIADAHPKLAPQVAAARETFDAAFPDVERKLEVELKGIFGPAAFLQFRNDMLDAVIDAQTKSPRSVEEAESYLAEVQRRARGEGLDQEVLDYLLAVQYAADPAAEFADGFRQRFRSDGSGKAQGIRLRLQLPRSWAAKEGELGNIVQKWTSEGGNGNAMILLGVQDARGFNPTKDDIARFIAQGGTRELAIGGNEIVDASPYTLETLAGFSALLRSATGPEQQRVLSWTQMYQVFFRGKAVSVMCVAIGREQDGNAVDQRLRSIQPLCRQVASSLVIEQLYD